VLGTLICHNFLGNASSTLIRRICFEKVGGYEGFRANGTQGCEDWDLYSRIAQYYPFKVVPEFLFGYRKSRSSMSSNPDSMARSHRHMLERVKQRHPRVPKSFYRLSTSSFYLYMAYECHYHKRPNESLCWLGRAVMSGPTFTLVRYGFYLLATKNLAVMLGAYVSNLMGRHREGDAARISRVPASGRIIQLKDVERKRVRIFLKTFAENVLHRLVTRCLSRRRDRQSNLLPYAATNVQVNFSPERTRRARRV
jgi:hypothetical protein